MKTKYKNVYLDNTPVRNAGADDLILSGSINKAGELTSITSVRTGGINGKNLVSASDETPKVWGYYGHDKTAIDMQVCAEYCKYVIENIANSNHSDKYNILRANKGLSLTTLEEEATGEEFDTFGSVRCLNLSAPSALNIEVTNRAQFPEADCTSVLKYLNILLNIQNELVEYFTQQTLPVIESFDVIGEGISAVESILGVGISNNMVYLGPDENNIFTYAITKIDGKNVYVIKSQQPAKPLPILKISEDDLLFILNYISATKKMDETALISINLLLHGIDYEPSEDAGGGTTK